MFDGGLSYRFKDLEKGEYLFVEMINCPHKRFLKQYDGFGCENKDYTDFVLSELG